MTETNGQRERRITLYGYAAVVVVALLVRGAYLLEMRDSALFDVLMGDTYTYDRWAQQIAGGDWYGNEVFYQAPLYPYFLAVNYKLLGYHVPAVRIVQALIGAASCLLLAMAGTRLLSRKVGVIAGLILAIYGPSLFFDGLIQKPVLAIFFTTLLLFLLAQCMVRMRWWWLAATGAVLGLFALTRENALVLVPIVAAWLVVHYRDRAWKQRLTWLGALVLGLAVVLAPVGLRNMDIGGTFLITTAQMGPNFYIGNSPEATGRYRALRLARGDPRLERQDATDLAEQALGRKLTAAEVSQYWMDRSLDYLLAQPGHWLRLMGKKCAMVINAREVIDFEAIEAAMDESVVLKVLGSVAHFGVLGPLALVGFCVTWSRRRELWLLYAIVLGVAGSTAAFYILARYRMPIVPVLALFAAAAIAHVTDHRTARRWMLAAPLVIGALIMNWPMGDQWDPRAITWENVGIAYAQLDQHELAEQQFRRVLEIYPDFPPALRSIGKTLRARGQYDAALQQYLRALQRAPNMPDLHIEFGELMLLTRQYDIALEAWRRALQISPNHPIAKAHLSWLDTRGVPPHEAIARCDRALEIMRQAEKTDVIPLIEQVRSAFASQSEGD